MITNRDNFWRYVVLGALFIAVGIFYVFTFIDLQVSGQDYYSMSPDVTTYTRKVKLQAQRGEVYDRNGKKLVANDFSYDIRLDYGSMPYSSAGKNEIILKLISILEEKGEVEKLSPHKYTPFNISTSGSDVRFEFNDDFFALARSSKYEKVASELNIPEDATADEAADVFMKRYALTDEDGALVYTPEETATLFGYRIDFDIVDFSSVNPYNFAEDVSLDYISVVGEESIRGYTVYCDYSRVYLYPGYASHILGRIGKISSTQVDYYTELGYSLDATVGTSGVEYAFESYLHGVDGELTITEDSAGNVIKTEVTKEPVAGLDVYLTIDIDMQIAAENALHDNILYVHQEAAYNSGSQDGEDSTAGAMTAMDPKTGEVLVLASYPTYDLSSFVEDVSYLNDDETAPMLNRALSGLFQPGSTFKPGVAVAALNEDIITPYTIIDTKGKYEAYEGYQPRCWLYLMYNDVHGPINVIEAIQESCNYFFYEVGDKMTIETLDRYMRGFGLGEPTGIELPEKTGVLAGPDYRNENGLALWAPGDTLQAAIGQSDHLFSPLQITSYISTLVNDGVRYSAKMLYKVCRYGTGEVVYERTPEVMNTLDVTAESCAVIRSAMKNVIDEGSASEMFEDYEITIGGKTGTAQVSKTKSDNAIFTAFAPFDDPEIVATCVIEQGNTGSNAGFAVKRLFDYHFGIGYYADRNEEDAPVAEEGYTDAEDAATEDVQEDSGDEE
ncbi:MAG: hypothetical protein IKV40_02820 [Clostridia bacterium]|nr:hypothetical protein [Clostridia bacterium]